MENCTQCKCSTRQTDAELLVDLYRNAKESYLRFAIDQDPAYRQMAEDVYIATGNMLEGMGLGFWNGENELAFYKDVYK